VKRDPYRELREAAEPAARTMLTGADEWDELADRADARGRPVEAEWLRREAAARRVRARRLLARAHELAAEFAAAYPGACA
jgi:hypothetical protein